MRNPFFRLLAVLALAVLGAAGCSDAVAPGSRETARIGFSLNVSGTEIHLLVVEVSAPDITGRLVFNVPVQNGVASGTLAVPAGAARTVSVRAHDAQGGLTHEGSATVDVKPGSNPPLIVALVPRPGHLPISVSFGSYVVHVSTEAALPPSGALPGQSWRVRAEVTGADGQAVPGAAVRWASADPSVATVTETGWVTAHRPGSAEIVATHDGYGGSILVTVAEAPPAPDLTAPELLSVSFSPETMGMDGTDAEVTLSLQVRDAGSGVRSVSAELRGPSGEQGTFPTRSCQRHAGAAPSPAPVSVTCVFQMPAYTQPGTWTLSSVVVEDGALNGEWLGSYDLGLRGIAASMQIGNPFGDVAAPTLDSLEVEPGPVAPGGSVYVQAHTSDAVSGTEQLSIGFAGPGGWSLGCNAYPTGNPGTFGCTLYPPASAPSGEWRLDSAMLVDRAGNYRFLTEAQLVGAGQDHRFTVAP